MWLVSGSGSLAPSRQCLAEPHGYLPKTNYLQPLLPLILTQLLSQSAISTVCEYHLSSHVLQNPNQPNLRDDDAVSKESASETATSAASSPDEPYSQSAKASSPSPSSADSEPTNTAAYDWEEKANWDIKKFTELPYSNFGVNQHMIIDREFKECMRQLLWKFRAPIRYAFAYGSGVFPQSQGDKATESEFKAVHPNAPVAVQRAQKSSPKMIDFIFGVSHTQHWHSLNLMQHRNHYSALGSLGSGAVSAVQDKWGAGVYFNTYVTIEGITIKYGVVTLETLKRDLREWDTLYLAGRLHKPVKILRDDPQVRMANQINLMSALRTALLLLPPTFTERALYSTIAGISYLGDPRMAFPTENPQKVANIVSNNMQNFRRLYAPLVESLPNVTFDDPACNEPDWVWNQDSVLKLQQDMDPVKRGNMVRRLPKAFRAKLYFEYQKELQIPQLDFNKLMEESKNEDAGSFKRQQGGGFEQRIAQDNPSQLRTHVRHVIKKTINWPSTTQSLKGPFTAGMRKTIRYLGEKMANYQQGKKQKPESEKSA
ncbi:mitochondrial matrix Mmp37-domain-containing protein [Pseudomassariella vexata]|uniref:Phosphatidate cytidylyltransferase, mitochondrial n=1 Tax=Pseudomassariella vexata TaxID=1141098 RepID=A0A1Y2DZY6_9PEZI|nr:mitochondrial matrix Mmp37-domain-containing protein [Pseudomassariella vexata]ORY64841.1 mitochondrial matrix Mmp37-domain-containing protein [Pseudomassariella vexata]